VLSAARFPVAFVASAIFVFVFASLAAGMPLMAADGAVAHPQETSSAIVVGFVGGFVRHDNPNHGPVQFAQRLERTAPKGAYVRVFENRHRKLAYRTILRLLDRNHDGVLAQDEKSQAHIILFGQSWGAASAVLLARDLNRVGVPVLLTVQVDSVAKFWQNDRVIPENVAAAVNFYQPHGLVHGRADITAADPGRTQILGNYRFDYKQSPVKCEGYSWFDRAFTPSHMESECDPRVWAQVEALVLNRLTPQSGVVAANPLP
jgi:pimeloyl-ACP methyl ester carboxylesterase